MFLALLALTGCLATKQLPCSSNAACTAYQANRPSVGDGDTLPTMIGVLNLDYAMEAACGE